VDQIVETSTDYVLSVEPVAETIRVEFGGETIAETSKALRLNEARYAPVYYIPFEDIDPHYIQKSDKTTMCPFKGLASYWNLKTDKTSLENIAWGYEKPDDTVADIEGHVSFYWDQMDAWYANGKKLEAPDRDATPIGSNPLTQWLLSEAWNASSTAELIAMFNKCLVEKGIPITRFRIIIKTLHPQLYARGFTWNKGDEEVTEFNADHQIVSSAAYIGSPFEKIINGSAGIRRQLEGENPVLDYPILAELIEEGQTDYVAMPLVFSDGQRNVFSMITDQPGGFSTDDLGHIYEIMPALSRLIEMHYVRRTAVTLLDTYLGEQTGKKVMEGQIRRGDGDDLYSVIWFCDLRNSTPLSESMPRDDYMRMLNQFLEAMAESVLDAGGEVLRYIGDAALAIFPITGDIGLATPVATKKALEAAKDALGRMTVINKKRSAAGENEIGFGIGLHLGDVTYGNIGSPNRLEFTVIGPAANEAARLEALTKEFAVPLVMSKKFSDCTPSKLKSLGTKSLRGVSNEQEIFTLSEF
jgi:adenylate cyclase